MSRDTQRHHPASQGNEISLDSAYQQLSSGKFIPNSLPPKPKKRILFHFFKSIIKNTLYPHYTLMTAMPMILEKWKNLSEGEKADYKKQCDLANLEIEIEIATYNQLEKIILETKA